MCVQGGVNATGRVVAIPSCEAAACVLGQASMAACLCSSVSEKCCRKPNCAWLVLNTVGLLDGLCSPSVRVPFVRGCA